MAKPENRVAAATALAALTLATTEAQRPAWAPTLPNVPTDRNGQILDPRPAEDIPTNPAP
jgi:hypothetical protein